MASRAISAEQKDVNYTLLVLHIFCYICGYFIVSKQKQNITDFLKKVYLAYFGIKLETRSCPDYFKRYAGHVLKI